jgi:hypothetical protein
LASVSIFLIFPDAVEMVWLDTMSANSAGDTSSSSAALRRAGWESGDTLLPLYPPSSDSTKSMLPMCSTHAVMRNTLLRSVSLRPTFSMACTVSWGHGGRGGHQRQR